MNGVISNRASAPPQRPEKPSPLAAVWQWANKAGAVIADLRSRISALESRPQARDGVSIASILIDQDNVLVATLSDGTSLKAGRVTPAVPAIDAASIEAMIAARVESAVAALSLREPAGLSAMQERIDGVYAVLAGFRQPKDGESVTIDDIRPAISAEVARAVEALPKPESPAPVVLPDFDRLVSDRVAAAVSAIPPAAPGKDVDLIIVQAMVAAEVAKLPRPKDGATIDELRPAIDDAVSRAVASLPKPKDGASVTIDDVAPMVRDEVSRAVQDSPARPEQIDMTVVERFIADRVAVAVAAIPPAAAGKDADPVVVQAMVAAEVARLPRPKDGKSIEESTIRAMVAEAVSAIPAPKDGESISEDVVRSMVVDAVNGIVGAWSPPQDGHTPTDEELTPLVDSAVQRAVSAIPKARDGVGIADMIVNADGRLSVVLTDNRRIDAGPVVPEPIAGPSGRSIDDASVDGDGMLVMTMSDGATITVGRVVGPPGENIKGDAGRGIASLRIVSNDLVARFTDGEEQLIGRVVGKPGKPGESIKGDKGSSFAFSTSYPANDIDQFRVVEMTDDDGNVRRMITLD